MAAVSLYFCAWVDVRFALVVIAAAAVNGALATAVARARAAARPRRRAAGWCGWRSCVDVAVLAVFAYHGFFLDSVTDVLQAVGLSATAPALGLLIPVGLSFVTLNAVSYVVDVGRGDVEPWRGVTCCSTSGFFPHLIAGPPVRVDELVPQFHDRPDPRRVPATDAFVLVGLGLFKAVVVAGYLATELVDPAFSAPGEAGGVTLLVALSRSPSRSTPASRGSPTSPSAAPCCSASSTRGRSTPRTGRCRSASSGTGGTPGVALAARLRLHAARRQPRRRRPPPTATSSPR